MFSWTLQFKEIRWFKNIYNFLLMKSSEQIVLFTFQFIRTFSWM